MSRHRTVAADKEGAEVVLGAPRRDDSLARAGWYAKVVRVVIGAVFRILFRVKVVGRENIPRIPIIVCANHLGWTDPFLVLLFFPLEPRIYVMGLHPGRISKFRERVVDSFGVMVAIERDKPRQALRLSQETLKRGGSLLIFPEGNLGEQEGTIAELQQGAAHMSVATNTPLLPVGLTGTRELWLRRTLVMRIGKPIHPEDFTGDLRTRLRDMTAALEAEMRALLPGDTKHPRVKLLRKWLTNLF
ncbi:MAG: 1-acyl-sn-glycerol-3-phosphate acyltransferase [Chloroflexota bacterium]|nr:1-acyl-sn-glycerol-3-phosphate acyltransferase [Chloroflexota bacterium]